jgi:hypothetical protein
MWKPEITINQERFGRRLVQVKFVGDRVNVVEMREFDDPKMGEEEILKWADEHVAVLEKASPAFVELYAKREISIDEMIAGVKAPIPKSEVEVLQEKVIALEVENAALKIAKIGGKG